MSFLLDALRKSEQQRRLGETPKIQVPILGSGESKPKRSRKLLLALGAVVIVMLLWLLFLQYSSTSDGSLAETSSSDATEPLVQNQVATPAGSPASANNQQAQNAPAQTVPPPAIPTPNNPVAGDTQQSSASNTLPSALSGENQEQAVDNFDELANQIAEREAQARELRQQQAQQLAAQREQEATAASAQAENSQPAAQAPEQVSGQAVAEPEQLTTDAEQSDDQWEPARPTYISYFELPVNVRQSLPEFSVSIRVFDEVPENRFAIIGRERVFEGDGIPGADGVELVEIKRQSLILEYQGYVFEYQ